MLRLLTMVIVPVVIISIASLSLASGQNQSPTYTLWVKWSPTGQMIAVVQIGTVSSDDDLVTLYSVDQNAIQHYGSLPNPPRESNVVEVGNVTWSPDGTRLAVARAVAGESVLEIWDVTTPSFQLVAEYFDDEISRIISTALAWRPGYDQVAMSNTEHIVLVDATNGSLIRTFEGPPELRDFVAEHITWSPDGSRLLGEEAPALLWDGDTGVILASLQADYGGFQPVVWSPDGTQFVASYMSLLPEYNFSLRIWDANTLQPVDTLDNGIARFPGSIDWQGEIIAALDGSLQGSILKFWDSQSLELIAELSLNDTLYDFALSPNGKSFVYVNESGVLNVHSFPIANAGPDQTLWTASGSALLTLDGTASTDSDGTITSYDWQLDRTTIAVGANPQVELPVGEHTITLVVTDNDGLADIDEVVITIEGVPSPTKKSPTGTAW